MNRFNYVKIRPTDQLRQRFWKCVDGKDPQRCWEWKGSINSKGYGIVWLKRRAYGAHRVSYALHHGDPGSMDVCHACDNPRCVNPHHLFLGTAAENMADAADKGRMAHGESSPMAKLNEYKVRVVRRAARWGIPQRRIAERMGVSQIAILYIIHGRTWAHVE